MLQLSPFNEKPRPKKIASKCLLIFSEFDGPDAEEFKREAGGAEQGPHAIPENTSVPV